MDPVADGEDLDTPRRAADTHVKRLCEKGGEASSAIETARGVGYRFGRRRGSHPGLTSARLKAVVGSA